MCSTINTKEMIKIKEENDLSQDGKQVKHIGIINSVKRKYTKKNTIMAFVTVEDLYGTTEIIVFDSCYSKSQNVLLEENIVLIDGRLSIREDDDVKIVANSISDFNEHSVVEGYNNNEIKMNSNSIQEEKKPKHLIINITNLTEEQKSNLRGAIKFFAGDKNNIAISVKQEGNILPCGGIYLTSEILEQFEEIVGKENILF